MRRATFPETNGREKDMNSRNGLLCDINDKIQIRKLEGNSNISLREWVIRPELKGAMGDMRPGEFGNRDRVPRW